MVRSIAAGLTLCAVLSVNSLRAQQPAPAPLVEKIDVRVVNVDVTVTDRSGNPVSGLTRDDFELFEDGEARPITHFDAIRKPVAGTVAAAAAAPVQERFKRKVLVLVDNMNTSKHGRNEALRNLEKFINDDFAGDYEWSIAMVDRRVRLLLPMTANKPRIHDVVADIARRGTSKDVTAPFDRDVKSVEAFGDPTAVEPTDDPMVNFREGVNRYEQSMFTLQSFHAISEAARAFASVEGKKIILLVTGRLPFTNRSLINTYKIGGSNSALRAFSPANKNFGRAVQYNAEATTMRDLLIAEANASNASFYIIGAEGLEVAEMTPATQAASGSTLRDTSDMYWMAKSTGGRFMPGNRISESLREFDETTANFYSLGYTPADQGSKYHRLKVRLKDPRGYHLQYREGFAEIADDVQLERTLHSYLGVTMQNATLPVYVKPQPVRYSAKNNDIGIMPFELSVPMARLQYIEQAEGAKARVHIYVSVFDHEDRFVTLARYVQDVDLKEHETPSGRMVVNFPGVSLRKGDYRLVVAVRDEVAESLGVSVQRVKL